MDPGVSVPLHSHGGKEYILVLEGSFCDEYGEYSKGDIQINDQKIALQELDFLQLILTMWQHQ